MVEIHRHGDRRRRAPSANISAKPKSVGRVGLTPEVGGSLFIEDRTFSVRLP
jgi:hypothetical protein